jgi:hypothetical protein
MRDGGGAGKSSTRVESRVGVGGLENQRESVNADAYFDRTGAGAATRAASRVAMIGLYEQGAEAEADAATDVDVDALDDLFQRVGE